MSKILEELVQKLQQSEQNKDEILQLIEQAKREDRSLSQTININQSADKKFTYSILGIIIEFSKKELIKDLINAVLLDSDIDINAEAIKLVNGTTYTALGVAILKDNTEAIRILLEIDNKIQCVCKDENETTYTALGLAVNNGNEEVIKTLLDHGEAPVIANAAKEKNGASYTALGLAIKKGNTEIIKIYYNLINL